MRISTHFWMLAWLVPLGAGCDDTAREVKREVNEITSSDAEAVREDVKATGQDAKRKTEIVADDLKEDLKTAGSRLKKEAEDAADSVKEAVDETDKQVARKLREESP
jgi:F0F1-type ATP synthase membrane subunit b/b'